MAQTVKLVKSGDDQSIVLPAEFRFATDEVSIRRNPETGEVILSPRATWPEIFQMLDHVHIPDDFLGPEERNQGTSPERPDL